MTIRPLRVAVIGQGYVGLPLALTAIRAGHTVFGVEIAEDRAKALMSSDSYIDDVSDQELVTAHATGRFMVVRSVAELQAVDIVVITVPTPLDADGRPDLRFVLQSIRGLHNALRNGATVVLESTTFPGTTEDIVAPILEEITGGRIGTSLHLGFSPERIDPGNRTYNTQSTPKLVSGITPSCLEHVRDFYQSLGIETVDVAGTREAEFAKLLENTFRLVNIALVNELAEYGHKRGIDTREAIRAASTKPFGYMPFQPGPGIGGHCIPIDPNYLAWDAFTSTGMNLDLVASAVRVNTRRPAYVSSAVIDYVRRQGLPTNAVVIVIGASYKADIVDVRESPAVRVMTDLKSRGCEVIVYDPVVGDTELGEFRVHGCLAQDDLERADVAVLITDHTANEYERLHQANVPIIDTRNRLGTQAALAL